MLYYANLLRFHQIKLKYLIKSFPYIVYNRQLQINIETRASTFGFIVSFELFFSFELSLRKFTLKNNKKTRSLQSATVK